LFVVEAGDRTARVLARISNIPERPQSRAVHVRAALPRPALEWLALATNLLKRLS
jgi:hypothetical protein